MFMKSSRDLKHLQSSYGTGSDKNLIPSTAECFPVALRSALRRRWKSYTAWPSTAGYHT